MGPRADLNGRKISSPPGSDPGQSSPYSVTIPTELPGPHLSYIFCIIFSPKYVMVNFTLELKKKRGILCKISHVYAMFHT